MKKIFTVHFFTICLIFSCFHIKTENNIINENNNNILTSDKESILFPVVIGRHNTGNYTLSQITHMTAFHITIDETESLNLEGIEQLPKIEHLFITLLSESNVDYSPIRSLPALNFVRLRGRGLTKIPDLSGIPSLVNLDINFSRLRSLNGIEKIPSLEKLNIVANRENINDITALRKNKKLKSIWFSEGLYNIDFNVLKDLPELEYLLVQGCGEVDLSGIDQLMSIRKLELISNISKETEELSVFKNLERIGRIISLKELYIDESITSIEFLAGNINMEKLTLIADEEREDYWTEKLPLDVKPLSKLNKLKRLVIRGFELKNADALEALPELEYLDTNMYGYE